MVLPTSAFEEGNFGRGSGSISHRVPVIFKRLHRFHQMVRNPMAIYKDPSPFLKLNQDFELAAWQLTYLCLAPRRV